MHAWRMHYAEMLKRGPPSPRLKHLVALLGWGARVLEVGCGNGRNTFYLQYRGVEVVALDVAIEPLLNLNCRCERVRATADFRLPFLDSTFDGVVDSYAFTFIKERNLYARELLRILKPNGMLLLEFDEEPHVKEHEELEEVVDRVFSDLFEIISMRRIYHAWGCVYDEEEEHVPSLAAVMKPRKA